MRSFSSYGPVNPKLHYYVPRKKLLDFIFKQLIGNNPEEGGHYLTVWAPRQTGKTWAMREILFRLRENEQFDVVKINLEVLKTQQDTGLILQYIEKQMACDLNLDVMGTDTPEKFEALFSKKRLQKPLILILDEFDALPEEAISVIVAVFRNIYNIRQDQLDLPSQEKKYLLHSVALIGVRSVLGVENAKGSPFNVQRSVHIPNLTFEEVEALFRWHEQESGQKVDQEVIERLFYETKGQPELTCWFGELLTKGWEQFRISKDMPINVWLFKKAYAAATYILPNNNILNIISKAKQEPYKNTLLNLFRTDEKMLFAYDDDILNYLYMNGVIDLDEADGKVYVKFPSPFIHKRLFSYFVREISGETGRLYDPLEDIDNAVTKDELNIRNIVMLYNQYLIKNRDWILKNAPRRSDMRIYEAVFHFNLYKYLSDFLESFKGEIYPEFPTGNGKIDLIVKYAGKIYGLEVKTFRNRPAYAEALKQAALYGKQLGLKEISLIFFIESIDDENQKKLETDYDHLETGVTVMPVFVETGN